MSHAMLRSRFFAAAKRSGAPVVFPGAVGTEPTYDSSTGQWSGGGTLTDVEGWAVQTASDPDKLAALGLVLTNPVRLLVAAEDLDLVPAPGVAFRWAGLDYTAKLVEPHGPDGDPIYFDVTGQR